MNEALLIGRGENKIYILADKANRHGLIAGATGTGKTVSLKLIAELFSDIGVPVFLPDVKGDLMGFMEAGEMTDKIKERLELCGVSEFDFKKYPLRVWDILNELGHPIRTTISNMGPLLLSKLMGLNDTQAGVLNIAFKVADDEGLLLLDIKDLKAMLVYIGENASKLKLEYGNVSPASIGAIQRAILVLENEGADTFFGEPALEIEDFIKCDEDGRGYINILNAIKLYQKPNLYSSFLLWFLSELYETLPEVGDLSKPKMVFFFDEAHLIFNNTAKVLVEKIEQIIKLIRSKGVGIFFITQNPTDIPDAVLAQLGNRIQHALRAFTPRDKKAIKLTADTFRQNPNFKIEDVITELKIGEALVSILNEDGSPSITERVIMMAPHSKIGIVEESKIKARIENSSLYYKYLNMIDRESAYELLIEDFKKRENIKIEEQNAKEMEKELKEKERERLRIERENKKNQGAVEKNLKKMGDSIIGTVSRSIGRQIARGLFGSVTKK